MGQILSALILSSLLVFGLSGCKKSQLNRDTSIAEDQAVAQALWNDVGNQVEGSSASSEVTGAGTNKWNNCATVTIDSNLAEYPLTVTLDFGKDGCEGIDGQTRKGKLIYTVSGPYTETGTIITVASNDYYLNDYRIEGIRQVKNEGPDNAGHIRFSVSVKDAIITTPDQKTITWESEHVRTWVEGMETGFLTKLDDGSFMGIEGLLDDVYEVTGTGSGINRDGRLFDVEVSEPLRLELRCRWITRGMLRISPEDLDPRVLDYGDGTCDNEATVTTGGESHTIHLGS